MSILVKHTSVEQSSNILLNSTPLPVANAGMEVTCSQYLNVAWNEVPDEKSIALNASTFLLLSQVKSKSVPADVLINGKVPFN